MRYPHTATITTPATGTLGADGDWRADDQAATQSTFECREEPNGGGRQITTADGKAMTYSSMVYAPATVTPPLVGEFVAVTDISGNTRLSGVILRVDFNDKHLRIWV